MKPLKIILFCIFVLLSNYSTLYANNSRQILLDHSMSFTIPENYESVHSDNVIWAGTCKEDPSIFAAIKTINIDNFEKYKVFAYLDTMLFNLSDYEKISQKQEPLFDLSRDFAIKKYVSKKDPNKFAATYTFYSFTRPYAMIIDYGQEANYYRVEELTSGLSKPTIGGWRQLLVFWKFGYCIMLLIGLLSMILPPLLKRFIGTTAAFWISLLITWGLIIYSMWGFPVAIIISMVITFLFDLFFVHEDILDLI